MLLGNCYEFDITENTDSVGNDIASVFVDESLSEEERLKQCGELCLTYNNCVGYAYVVPERRCVPKHTLKSKPWSTNAIVTMGERICGTGKFAYRLVYYKTIVTPPCFFFASSTSIFMQKKSMNS